jgi:hypothetical protein
VGAEEDECRRSRGWTVRAERVSTDLTAGKREDPAVAGAPDDAAVELVGRALVSGVKDVPHVPLTRTSALRPTVKVMGEMRFEAPAVSFDPNLVVAVLDVPTLRVTGSSPVPPTTSQNGLVELESSPKHQ